MKEEKNNSFISNETIMPPKAFLERFSMYKKPTLEGFITHDDSNSNNILFGYTSQKCPNLPIPNDNIEMIQVGNMYRCLNTENIKGPKQMWQATIFLKLPESRQGEMFADLLQLLQNTQLNNGLSSNNCQCGCTGNSSKSTSINNIIPNCPEGCYPHPYCCGPYPDICSEICWDCDCAYTSHARNERKKHCTMWFGVEGCPDFRWRKCTYDGINWWTEQKGSCYTNAHNPVTKNKRSFGANFREKATCGQMNFSVPPQMPVSTSATVSYPEGTDPYGE